MPKYKDKNGTTRVGDALRWLVKQGKNIAPSILDAAGSITGIESLKELSKQIEGSTQLTEADKEILLEELRHDMLEMQETTKRWVSDNQTESYLTRNIRPLTLAFLTATLFIYIILDMIMQLADQPPKNETSSVRWQKMFVKLRRYQRWFLLVRNPRWEPLRRLVIMLVLVLASLSALQHFQ